MRLAVLVLLLALGACVDPERPEDEGLLDRERFTEVLLEAQLLEARVNHELVMEQLVNIPTDRYYDDLFRKHGTDREQFARTYAYYAARPEELSEIYEEIITELTRRKDSPEAQPPAP